MHKLGSLSPLIYFVNHTDPAKREGYLMVAPYTDCPTPKGWSREEAATLHDCYSLQKRLQEQELDDWQREGQVDIEMMRKKFTQTRERMIARMSSSSTTPFDRDFMAAYLQLQEEKLAKHEERFNHRNMYLYSLEHDAPRGRRDDEESFNVDRIS